MGGRISGGAQRRGHERGAPDNEAEREHAGGYSDGARADRLVEDQDSAEDRGEVGCHRRDRDDLDGLADLEATRGRVEGDHERDQRRERPGAEQAEDRPVCVVRYLIATSETPNSTPAAVASSNASPRCSTSRRVEILTSPIPNARIAVSTAISAASEERCGPPEVAESDHRQPSSSERHPSPLASSEMKPEEPLGEHGKEHKPARQNRLHDRGASASASMCRPQANSATIHPTSNHRERNRSAALRNGWRTWMGRAIATAPRALNKPLKLVPSAETSAKPNPRIIRNAALFGEMLAFRPGGATAL